PHLLHFSSTAASPSGIYTLSLHDALPISILFQPLRQGRVAGSEDRRRQEGRIGRAGVADGERTDRNAGGHLHDRQQRIEPLQRLDRKSTRLNSSHLGISYAVFCLKKKKQL